jgi:chorismate mutase-like protein
MKKSSKELDKIRQKIDTLDQEIADLINQRGQYALQVAKIKRENMSKPIYYRPTREAQIFQQRVKNNPGPIANRDMVNIFRHILSACRALQQPLTVAVLDIKGRRAAHQHFGASIKTLTVTSIVKLFQKVLAHQAHYGIVPIEHSRKGIVAQTLDAFIECPVQVCGEIELFEAKQRNSVRFLIVGDHCTAPSAKDKTSLLISTVHQPGSLARFFQPFARHQVNITAIAAHPLHNELWRYVFFLEVEGHQQEATMKNALAELGEQPLTYRVLGSYPRSLA